MKRFITAVALVSSAFAQADTVTVTNFVELSNAVDNSSAGDTILLADGVYNTTLDINHSLTFRALNADASPHINAMPCSFSNSVEININDGHVVFDGITIGNESDKNGGNCQFNIDIAADSLSFLNGSLLAMNMVGVGDHLSAAQWPSRLNIVNNTLAGAFYAASMKFESVLIFANTFVVDTYIGNFDSNIPDNAPFTMNVVGNTFIGDITVPSVVFPLGATEAVFRYNLVEVRAYTQNNYDSVQFSADYPWQNPAKGAQYIENNVFTFVEGYSSVESTHALENLKVGQIDREGTFKNNVIDFGSFEKGTQTSPLNMLNLLKPTSVFLDATNSKVSGNIIIAHPTMSSVALAANGDVKGHDDTNICYGFSDCGDFGESAELPDFVDRAGRNYALKNGSIGIDVGGTSYIDIDRDGTARDAGPESGPIPFSVFREQLEGTGPLIMPYFKPQESITLDGDMYVDYDVFARPN